MISTTFETNTRFGPRRYVIEGGRLRMTGKAPFKTLTLDVDLKDIAPHFDRQRLVAFRFIRNSMLCICAIVLLATLLSRIASIPTWALIGGALLLSSGFMREILKWSRPIEVEPFRSHAGVTVFEVWREKGYERAFDEFIESLHAAVIASQERKDVLSAEK
jgi:hypothetical protein